MKMKIIFREDGRDYGVEERLVERKYDQIEKIGIFQDENKITKILSIHYYNSNDNYNQELRMDEMVEAIIYE